uniref:Uncharacterized protein n=1 Tax=Pithovirus LCPAC101 TaxID=2506586 RepID=A0A481Z5V0_9VIRU|nr:MAG: hypothetical protein LCPAC101_03050 [Pithovirus LCPAC101]
MHTPSEQAVAPTKQSDKVVHGPPMGTLHTELEQTRPFTQLPSLEHADPNGKFIGLPVEKKNTKIIIIIIINIIINIIIPIF